MSFQRALLLNATNMEKFPVYPYAFIQVPAIAREKGVDVICKDLLGIPTESWRQTIQTLIEQYAPSMILITIRNTDSLVAQDYEPDSAYAYFPIERTKELITTLRAISDLKIVLGGFGFSLLPQDLMEYLHADMGVVGGPDGFFAHFGEIKNGDYSNVPNLMFYQGNQLISNPRILYPPFADAEYTPQTIAAMMRFYEEFPSPGFQGAPVEIIHGCCHTCRFCAEPISVGRQVRYRDPGGVMKDIQILTENGITKIYMISSELNSEGNEYILHLADMICAFNASRPEQGKITWYGANYLLTFEADEYERLYQSGFTGGWFDIAALDNQNARAMRTPYRNERLIKNLKKYAEATKRQINLRRKPEDSGSETPLRAGDGREDEFVRWTMFLGNPATTIETIRNTLQTANQEGLPAFFDECGIIGVTRVFDYEGVTESMYSSVYSVKPDLKRTTYHQLLPSFTYPPALLADFTEEEISMMFSHLAETYLSNKYQRTRHWRDFVQQSTTVDAVSLWLKELSYASDVQLQIRQGQTIKEVKELHALFQKNEQSSGENESALEMVDLLVSECLNAFPDYFKTLGLPDTTERLYLLTPYELATIVFTKWEFAEGQPLKAGFNDPQWKQDLLQFCIRAILYRLNIVTDPKYGELIVGKNIKNGDFYAN